jgi:hypothetical protein
MEGLAAKPPHAPEVPQFKAWMKGWQEGQAAIFKIGKTPPDIAPLGDAKPTHQVV